MQKTSQFKHKYDIKVKGSGQRGNDRATRREQHGATVMVSVSKEMTQRWDTVIMKLIVPVFQLKLKNKSFLGRNAH